MNKSEVTYFSSVAEGDEIFGLVFGHGVVQSVWGPGHYEFEVQFDNSSTVAYTKEGYPSWGSGKLDFQTIYYKKDVDIFEYDISPNEQELLTPIQIIKLRLKKKLLVRCPSGLWQPVEKCPGYIAEDYLENNQLHLFKKLSKDQE